MSTTDRPTEGHRRNSADSAATRHVSPAAPASAPSAGRLSPGPLPGAAAPGRSPVPAPAPSAGRISPGPPPRGLPAPSLAPAGAPRPIDPRFEPAAGPALDLDDGIRLATDLLRGRRLAVLTGAGISTDSGIPDYRGPGSPPRRPMTYQQFVSDVAFRRTYWARNHVGWRHVRGTLPNAGHQALARMEERGVVVGVITQNVDRLHANAGSRRVVDLHGTYEQIVCLDCGVRTSRAQLAMRLELLNPGFSEAIGSVADVEVAPDADAVIESTQGFVVADCERCGGMLKPDIVYFGESVPKERVARAFALVDDADALLVAGTSLAVMSGLRFVRHAARTGCPVVIVNRGGTRGDALATLRVHAGTSEALTELDARL